MATTSKVSPSVAASPRLTPTDRLMQLHEENVRLAAENAAYREREQVVVETPRPIPVETVRPQPIPVAAPAAAAVPPIRPIRPIVETDRGFDGWAWLGRIIILLSLALLLLSTFVFVKGGGLDWLNHFFASPWVTSCNPCKPAPSPKAAEILPPAKICDDDCQHQIIRVRCGADHRVFTDRIDITPEQFGVLVDKVCKVAAPVVAPPADPIVQKIYVRELPPKAKPHKKVVIRRPPPPEEVVDTPTTCSLWVQTWEQIGTGVPRTNTVRVWINGRKVAGPVSVRGDGYVRVPCSVVYGHDGKICFGFGPGSESELVDAAWLADARQEVENGSSVINPRRPIRWAAYGPNGE